MLPGTAQATEVECLTGATFPAQITRTKSAPTSVVVVQYRLQRVLPRPGSLAAMATGVAIFAAAALCKVALDRVADDNMPPFITFYPAVVLISLTSGTRVGLIAVAVALALSWYFWIVPFGSFDIVDWVSFYTIVTFAVFGGLVSAIVGVTRELLDEHTSHEVERKRITRETVHRIKNLIAVVQAISTKVSRQANSFSDYNTKFASRLAALASAQDVLVKTEWEDVRVSEIIDSALAPFRPNPALVVRSGPDIMLPARFVSGVSLALYELATNAMKYGALQARPGSVVLTWASHKNRGSLVWKEVPTHAERPIGENTGFGTILIQSAFNRASGTQVHYEVRDAGVTAEFEWPLETA
jgi:two-component sensor histidine kinase